MPPKTSRHTAPRAPWTRFPPTRSFVADGISWHAFEVSDEFERRGGRALVFECDHAWRRVRRYPPDWHELSTAEMTELMNAR